MNPLSTIFVTAPARLRNGDGDGWVDVSDPAVLAAAYAAAPVDRTEAQWVAIWSDQGRHADACEAAGGAMGFRGCAAPPEAVTAGFFGMVTGAVLALGWRVIFR